MPDLTIKVQAKDEATGVFDRVKLAARDLQAEQRAGGDKALERMLKGGATLGLAGFAVEELGKFGKASKEVFDTWIKGGGDATESVNKLLGSIPVFGEVYDSVNSVVGAAQDGAAAFAKWAGASDETVKSLESYDEQIEESNRKIEAQTKLQKLLGDAKRETARETSASGEAGALAEIDEKYQEQIDKNRELVDGIADLTEAQKKSALAALDMLTAQQKSAAIAKQNAKDNEDSYKRAQESKRETDRANRELDTITRQAEIDRLRIEGHDEEAEKKALQLEKEQKFQQIADSPQSVGWPKLKGAFDAVNDEFDAKLAKLDADASKKAGEQISVATKDVWKDLRAGFSDLFKGAEGNDKEKTTKDGSAPDLESSRFLRGASYATRERNLGPEQQQVQHLATIAKGQEKIHSLLETLLPKIEIVSQIFPI